MLVPASSEPGWLGLPGKKKNLLFHPEFFSKSFNVVCIHNLDLFSVVHVHNLGFQCYICAQLEIIVLCMCTTKFFSVVLVHKWISRCCACAQLDFSVLCTCTTELVSVVPVQNWKFQCRALALCYFFGVMHVHNWICKYFALAQLEITGLWTCTA